MVNKYKEVKLLLAFICKCEKEIKNQRKVIQISELRVLNIGKKGQYSIEDVSMKSIYNNKDRIVGLDVNLSKEEIYTDFNVNDLTKVYIEKKEDGEDGNWNSFTLPYNIPKIIEGKLDNIENKFIKLCFKNSLERKFDLILYCELGKPYEIPTVLPIFDQYCMLDGVDMSSSLKATKYSISIYNEDQETITAILNSLINSNSLVYEEFGSYKEFGSCDYDKVGYRDISKIKDVLLMNPEWIVVYIDGRTEQSNFIISLTPNVRCIVEAKKSLLVTNQIQLAICLNAKAKIFFKDEKFVKKYPNGLNINNLKKEPRIKAMYP